MKQIKKRKNRAFGKDIYLLGKFASGEYFWLEAATWDCNWYWGFGYVKSYTNNKNPELAKDVCWHQHVDGLINLKIGGNYCHRLAENPNVEECVLSKDEDYEFSSLLEQFYTLKKAAALFHQQDKKLWKILNEQKLPLIFDKVYALLTPGDNK